MKSVVLLLLLSAGQMVPALRAASFLPGNLVIYRVGTGSGGLLSSATAVFLDEYTPSGGLVQSVALPTAVSGAQRRLTASGTATTEGSLQRSADRRFLTLTGYDADPGTASVAGTQSATVNRIVGFVDASGVVDTRTAVTAFNAQNIRSAVSDDGTGAWLCGGNSGVVYVTAGSSGAGTVIATASSNNRSLDIFGGQLFLSSGSGSYRLAAVAAGLPKNPGASVVQVAGGPATTGSPYQFVMFDLDPVVPGTDTLYVADETAGTGGIQKFCLNDGTWLAKGNVAGSGELTSIRGLTGVVSENTVRLFGTNSIRLLSLTDSSGFNGVLTGTLAILANAAPNTGFRGVDFAPVVAAPAAPVLSVSRSAGGVSVSWPLAGSAGWTLQQTSFPATGPWISSSGVVEAGSVKSLTLAAPAGRMFFRLAFP